MTGTWLGRLAISFLIAVTVHIGVAVAMTAEWSPPVLIEGGSISVRLSTDGTNLPDSAPSAAGGHGRPPAPAEPDRPAPEEAHAPPLEAPDDAPHEAAVSNQPEATAPPEADTAPPEEHAEALPAPEATPPAPAEADAPPPEMTEPPPEDVAAESAHDQSDDLPLSMASAAAAGGRASAAAPSAATPGNAASTNYAGEVMGHLSRFRRPRAPGPGSARVTFTIAASGEIATIEVSESSGSPRFDRDAAAFIERAAPFPVPPSDANSTFTVEIEGR